jgi:cell wall-associated NlpC family hydrolase
VTLPRTSAEQAREGRAVGKNPSKLYPGDLLTFSNQGGAVTHVGLYIGGGRFIHSATRGVQISVLSADDPYGRWWWKRWVGVRRIVE